MSMPTKSGTSPGSTTQTPTEERHSPDGRRLFASAGDGGIELYSVQIHTR